MWERPHAALQVSVLMTAVLRAGAAYGGYNECRGSFPPGAALLLSLKIACTGRLLAFLQWGQGWA